MPVRALEELQLSFPDLPEGDGVLGQLDHIFRGPYPPPPVAGAPVALPEMGRRGLDAVFIDQELIRAVSVPVELDYIDPRTLANMARSWRSRALPALRSFADVAFGTATDLGGRLAPTGDRVHRVVVNASDGWLTRIPWELAWAERQGESGAFLIRRALQPAGGATGAYSLPLQVGVVSLLESAPGIWARG